MSVGRSYPLPLLLVLALGLSALDSLAVYAWMVERISASRCWRLRIFSRFACSSACRFSSKARFSVALWACSLAASRNCSSRVSLPSISLSISLRAFLFMLLNSPATTSADCFTPSITFLLAAPAVLLLSDRRAHLPFQGSPFGWLAPHYWSYPPSPDVDLAVRSPSLRS